MALAAGSRLGSYEIVAPLGAGGMGEVYRARDTRLERDVAIKVLPGGSLDDETARARLMREARLAATLNHPNICTVHEVGEAEGRIFLAMELIEGKSLAAKIAESPSGLPTENVMRYGAQIAAALAHAHERHVIHRDLKSANVIVTEDGRAKVLDFGLARSVRPAPGESEATQSLALTRAGTVVGTPHAMAPEVLRGGEADERSDVWALGVVLHEMASGALPFKGQTSFELASAILNDVPGVLPARLPAGLRAIVARCLAKAPGERYQRASEVRAALDAVHPDGAVGTSAAVARPPRSKAMARAVLAAGVVVAVTILVVLQRRSAAPHDLKQRQMTSNPAGDPVGVGNISPDGKSLAVVDRNGLSLRSVESGESHALDLPAGFEFVQPFPHVSWYPDGSQLLISGRMADGRPAVWALPVTGGRTRRILDDAWFATLSPDGTHIAYVVHDAHGANIMISGVNGEDAHRVTGDDSSGVIPAWPTWAPNGKRLIYGRVNLTTESVRLESCDRDGRVRVFYVPSPDQPLHFFAVPAWLPDGRVVFGLTDPAPNQRDVNLWSLRVDSESGEALGVPTRVTQWQNLALVMPTSVSSNGKRMTVGVMQYQSDVYVGRIAAADAPLEDVRRLTLDDRMDVGPAWLAEDAGDDSTIVFSSDRNGTLDIFRQRLGATVAEPLVTGAGDQYSPQPSADKSWLLYTEQEPTPPGKPPSRARIMRIAFAGGPPAKVLDMQGAATFLCSRASGASPVLCETRAGTVVFTAFDPVRGRGREVAHVVARAQSAWALSPDGAAITVVVASQDSIPTLRVLSTSGGASRDIRLDRPAKIQDLAYAADGRSWLVIAYSDQNNWWLLHVDAHGRTAALIPPQLWMYSAVPSPDGKRVAFTSNTGQDNVWMLEDF